VQNSGSQPSIVAAGRGARRRGSAQAISSRILGSPGDPPAEHREPCPGNPALSSVQPVIHPPMRNSTAGGRWPRLSAAVKRRGVAA